MRKFCFITLLIVMCSFVFGTTESGAFSKEYRFTVPSRGVTFYEITVPEKAQQIIAVISQQTQMVNLSLYAPGRDKPSSKNSTWSQSSWKNSFKCSVNKPKAGVWRIKVQGSVHVGNVKKYKTVSGLLTVSVDGVPESTTSSTQSMIHASYPLVQEYGFTVPSRGTAYYEIIVPEKAKQIKAVISRQTQMVNLSLYAPGKDKPSSNNSTWSQSSWKNSFKCSVNNPKAGAWKVKVEGSVHVGNVKKYKTVSGLLTITVDPAS